MDASKDQDTTLESTSDDPVTNVIPDGEAIERNQVNSDMVVAETLEEPKIAENNAVVGELPVESVSGSEMIQSESNDSTIKNNSSDPEEKSETESNPHKSDQEPVAEVVMEVAESPPETATIPLTDTPVEITEAPPVEVILLPPTTVPELVAEEILDVSKTEAVLTSSLALIANYGMSDDSESDSESSSSSSSSSSSDEEEVKVVDTVSYRNTVNVISSGESGESDVEFVEGSEEGPKKRPKKIIKAKGEMDMCDLPPIEDLNISVPEHECIELGKIMSVVDQLVLVESNPGNIALDLDTVLFLDNGKRALGRIFDVLGQVNQPIYCVRFNSAEQIQEKDILPGMKVYYNNQRPEHTSVVVLPHLLRFKGSDASWDHDIEPPEGCLEYSDDEAERSARKSRKTGQKAIPEDPSQQRMKRVRQPPPPPPQQTSNRQARVRNPFAGPRYSHPPPPLPGNNNNQWNSHQNHPQMNQWPQQNHPGYGNEYNNYSWHTFYQQQQHQQQPHMRYPPPPPANSHGPFYINPYAQQGPGTSAANNAVQQAQQMNYNGNYYAANGQAQGPSNNNTRQFKQEKH